MPDPNKDNLYEVPRYSDRDGGIAWILTACIIAAVVLLVLASCGVGVEVKPQ